MMLYTINGSEDGIMAVATCARRAIEIGQEYLERRGPKLNTTGMEATLKKHCRLLMISKNTSVGIAAFYANEFHEGKYSSAQHFNSLDGTGP